MSYIKGTVHCSKSEFTRDQLAWYSNIGSDKCSMQYAGHFLLSCGTVEPIGKEHECDFVKETTYITIHSKFQSHRKNADTLVFKAQISIFVGK